MPASFYGVLTTALGIGLTVGSMLATFFSRRLDAVRVFWVALFREGTMVVIYSRLSNFFLALFLMTSVGVVVAFINVTASPLILHTTPRKFVARVNSSLFQLLPSLQSVRPLWLAFSLVQYCTISI